MRKLVIVCAYGRVSAQGVRGTKRIGGGVVVALLVYGSVLPQGRCGDPEQPHASRLVRTAVIDGDVTTRGARACEVG